MDSPPPGAIHIRCCGALAPGTSRKPASSGWALSNHGVRPDGVEEELRRAHGAVPAQCTHAGTAPPHAAPAHTQKAAQQAAVTHALGCASRWLKQPHVTVIITVDSPTTLHDLQSEAAPRGRRRQRPPAAAAAAERQAQQGREESSGKRRRKAPPQSGNKRTRTGADEDGGVDEAPQPSLQRTARNRSLAPCWLRSSYGVFACAAVCDRHLAWCICLSVTACVRRHAGSSASHFSRAAPVRPAGRARRPIIVSSGEFMSTLSPVACSQAPATCCQTARAVGQSWCSFRDAKPRSPS